MDTMVFLFLVVIYLFTPFITETQSSIGFALFHLAVCVEGSRELAEPPTSIV